ncbi:Poly(A) polymerase type 3 [Clohesyomyces aquaticus]|uniref:polynucleotide adenylyltransferase n=1 Tax=Clohesyomyces aquaticus TaxID=1231657 RepID=A0A1Y1ZHP3_9PLEO|nr:Poly(A) polymerase type 3 [Clohesyomyces aquaticus]
MAAIDESGQFCPLAINSYETALCVIPPAEKCRDVDNLRSLYDKGYGRWPPHVNLMYPFVAPENLQRAKDQIVSKLSKPLPEAIAKTSTVSLGQAGSFSHRTNHTIFVGESKGSTRLLASIRCAALEALGQASTPCHFHLTIGQSEDHSASSRDFLLSKAKLLPSLKFQIGRLAILVRERTPGQDTASSRMRLWGTIDLPAEISPHTSSLSEFWIDAERQQEESLSNQDEEEEDERGSDVAVESSPFNRQPQAGTTYRFERQSKRWETCSSIAEPDDTPENLTISSYNVLIDSEYPPARDRDPLLLETIISKLAKADILVLQEVSDDFLSFLLSDNEVQQNFPFASHGPPSQPDIGPLPSLRNVVVLSRWAFSWVLVPFHRRHKAAVVAYFQGISQKGSSEYLPLVVAGVHLTCGLTDGSVAAKKVQIQNLKNYLSRSHASNPWIIAGDFNITTSSYTIETALKKKAVSAQTCQSLSSIESMMNDAGLLDAWAVARVEAVDHDNLHSNRDSDDLFEGEEGATFDPRVNELAAATSGTSLNRPQRYDRILVRPQGLLQVSGFNRFGFPASHGDDEIVPSDHWGIRCSMKIMSSADHKALDSLEALNANPVQPINVSGDLADTSDLASALSAHQMCPTKEEVQSRDDAFALIKTVLLGSSDDEDTSLSDIPMVIVPVGSYAMGVWTSTSDIDCLCIGSISSKTFFKLARQRVHRAEAQGVRLIRRVEAHTGTMLELSVNGISVDLQYCPAARIVERWAEMSGFHHSDPIFNLSMLSLRKLKPYRDITYIQRTLPSTSTFRTAYRCIKLWAVQRGLYSSRFGYLSGIHLTLMLSSLYKQMVHDAGSVTATDLVATFFHHYAEFDYKNSMIFDPFFHRKTPRYQRSVREPVVMLGFHAPNANVAHTSTVPGLKTLVKELQMASDLLAEDRMTWEAFFGGAVDATTPKDHTAGVTDFLKFYESYAKVDIQYWGRTLRKGKELVGWVESRCLLLVVDIAKVLPHLEVRIWPARFANASAEESETEYNGCYLIGLSKGSEMHMNVSKEDRQVAKNTLQKSLEKFEAQLQADEKYYDPSSCWVGVSLAKPSNVSSFQLDAREWGDYEADVDEDSDEDEDAEDTPEDLEDDKPAAKKVAIRQGPAHTTKPVSSSKLRPASDVLNRLRWDPDLNPSDYIVGYEDRFLGAKETSLERWKTEQTDDEFIPQHRILYFKKKSDGVVVWERKTRIDRIFGSGVGAGEAGLA